MRLADRRAPPPFRGVGGSTLLPAAARLPSCPSTGSVVAAHIAEMARCSPNKFAFTAPLLCRASTGSTLPQRETPPPTPVEVPMSRRLPWERGHARGRQTGDPWAALPPMSLVAAGGAAARDAPYATSPQRRQDAAVAEPDRAAPVTVHDFFSPTPPRRPPPPFARRPQPPALPRTAFGVPSRAPAVRRDSTVQTQNTSPRVGDRLPEVDLIPRPHRPAQPTVVHSVSPRFTENEHRKQLSLRAISTRY
eukprot:TRINITY_DN87_c9_g1_i1.p1 TRINITY_DN87_c9_g1~~TRINITY_DN87_c9_g1_i1.p1  ORF type:complete len:249 (+),score=13.17 TRINITY_DN87_c9_g1_i1:109-855(+)